jgi:hypothetical protein
MAFEPRQVSSDKCQGASAKRPVACGLNAERPSYPSRADRHSVSVAEICTPHLCFLTMGAFLFTTEEAGVVNGVFVPNLRVPKRRNFGQTRGRTQYHR